MLAKRLARGEEGDLTGREAGLVRFAALLTRSAGAVVREDVDALRAAGLNDREVHDLVMVIGYFAFVNRVVLGLGGALERGGELGEWPAV